MTSAVQQLREAQKIIAEQPELGKYLRRGSCFCALQALAVAQGRGESDWSAIPETSAALRTLASCIGNRGYDNRSTVYHYNDAKDTTKEDIVRLFDQAIRKLTPRGKS